ncbi:MULTISPECIES: hypothetical protein [unclassified Mesotoga]|uniref:hypothetical protein n=1 Tax=unclassified Mesotoga TaxID=1184398 RepID=UPI0015E8C979|nr:MULTISPECIES: hypothetical protein [unclassified Mesotoga]
MSRMVLMLAGVVFLVVALLASIGTVVVPGWHIVFLWIGGAIMVLVAFMDKGKKTKSES